MSQIKVNLIKQWFGHTIAVSTVTTATTVYLACT